MTARPARLAKPRHRNRRSAKKAGTSFETQVQRYLAWALGDERIVRRAKTGAKDRGDIGGLRALGQPIAVEVKNTAKLDLAGWAKEAEAERGNDDAIAGVVIFKRHGVANPEDQWATMTLRDLAAILTGARPEEQEQGAAK